MNCLFCHNPIPIKRNRDKEKYFCDRHCAGQFRRSPIVLCKYCGHAMSSANGRVFCSKKCANRFRSSKYIKLCENCGKPFILHNRAYEKRGKGKLCSLKCAREKQRKYICNESFFKTINNQKKAYWLGFLYADGNQNGYEITLKLKQSDFKHIYKFKQDISSTNPVHLFTTKENRKQVEIRINSKKLCLFLEKWGCVKAKSLIVEYPALKSNLERHFIRGYFDGDGCVGYSRSILRIIFFSGSVKFIDGLEKSLVKNGLILHRGKKDPRFLSVSKKSIVLSLYKFLYNKSNVSLSRKKEIFDKWIDNKLERPFRRVIIAVDD